MNEPTPRPVTIYDVARAAGVATSTVSRTFARPGRVNAETAARVRRAADELGYHARIIGQAAGSASTRLLAVMVADITNPFWAQVVRGAQTEASKAGYEILLADARESGIRERAAVERLLPVVEGVVIGGSRMADSAIRTIAKQKPLVVANRELSDVPSVLADYRGGMKQAVDHLRELGHRSAVYVAGPEASWANGARYRAFRDLGAEAGMVTQRIGPFAPTFEGGLAAARQLVGRHPSAVIAFNDQIAAGAMYGLQQAGVRVPEQVSIIGFDGTLTSRLIRPALTTVAAPMRELGSAAVGNLIAIVNGARSQGGALVLPMKLQRSDSTGRCRERQAAAGAATGS